MSAGMDDETTATAAVLPGASLETIAAGTFRFSAALNDHRRAASLSGLSFALRRQLAQ